MRSNNFPALMIGTVLALAGPVAMTVSAAANAAKKPAKKSDSAKKVAVTKKTDKKKAETSAAKAPAKPAAKTSEVVKAKAEADAERLAEEKVAAETAAMDAKAISNRHVAQELLKDIHASRERISYLESQRNRIQKDEQAKLPMTEKGIELFEKYDRLIQARYIDDDGKFLPELEISSKDVSNLNSLSKTFMKSRLLETDSAISARNARKSIEATVKRLNEQAKAQDSPSKINNSEFQIVEYQIAVEEAKIEQIEDSAKRSGVDLDSATRDPANKD